MIRKDHKKLQFFFVALIAVLATWQGKKNLAGVVNIMTDSQCEASMLLIKCQK